LSFKSDAKPLTGVCCMLSDRMKRTTLSFAKDDQPLPHGVDLAADLKRQFPDLRLDLIFDVGANVGQTAQEFGIQFRQAKILSFEPDPDSFSILQASANGNANLSIYNLGFSVRPGRVRFDNTSPESVLHAIAKNQGDDRLPFVNITTIDLFCAEHCIERISLLKIDTEGHDLDVIRGASDMLRRGNVDVVFAECSLTQVSERLVSFSEMQANMRERGYVCFGIYQQAFGSDTHDPQINWANCAYVSKTRSRK
jgi:FkbM family methyltransferase